MDRRLFLTGLLGVGAVGTIASVLPKTAHAFLAAPSGDQASDILPKLDAFPEADDDPIGDADGVIDLVSHRRRRRRRVRRWRRRCRRYWYHGHRRRRCRRVPYWAWIWFYI
ncbi:MAG TPA: protamine-2 (modular protein) [Aestuariivirgaceae bacterium]|jgi:hypothetical protein